MTLFDISTYITRKIKEESPDINDQCAVAVMEAFGITDYGIMESLISEGRLKRSLPYFIDDLNTAYKVVERFKGKDADPLHVFPAYEESGYNKKLLISTDLNTFCDVLPFNSPLNHERATANRVKNISIADAKHLLSHYSHFGTLALCAYLNSFGNAKANRVASLIHFYEEQILRTADLVYPGYCGNLFTKDKEDKTEIVTENLLPIAEYLMENGNDFIWGSMKPQQKERLLNSIATPKGMQNQMTKEKIIRYITDYTTLPEIEDDLTRKRALDRFIR